MKVSELAKELRTTDAVILTKLKGLHLKAKDGNQELSKAVITVLRGEVIKDLKASFKVAEVKKVSKEEPKPVVAEEPPVKRGKEKIGPVKEKPTPKVAAKKEEAPAPKPAEKKEPAQKAAEKGVEKPIEKPVAKPTVTPKEESKKAKAEEEPFTPLKPLLKKKRRVFGRPEAGEKHAVEPTSAAVEGGGLTKASAPFVTQGTEHLPVLEVNIPISIKDFAITLNQKPSIVLQKLIKMGFLATINQGLGEDLLRKLAQEFGYQISRIKTSEEKLIADHKIQDENPELLKNRAPVVTFMGHVDHGKTSLLDRIRKSEVAESEHGGITQHIGAYSVETPKGRITFLDTPGHEAFTAMRARGAHITDLVVLVVAADEGIMPQTEEAIAHARAAGVPILVALNKIDRRDADPDRVKKQLSEHELMAEDWGGKTIVASVSATTGEGISHLLDMILLESEMLELRANPDKSASGIVVEAHLSRGKGPVACLIVQSGTLKMNDIVVVGSHYGRVKAIIDDRERALKEAGPSMPVEIMGLPAVPEAGDEFYVVEEERKAREIAETRREQLKMAKLQSSHRLTLEDLYSQIQEGKIKELNVILKADVQGSLEALKDSLEKIPSREVKVKFIHLGVGDITSSDVILAIASNAIIIGFHVDIGTKAQEQLEKDPVDVRQYRIIYDAVNDMRKALEGLLEPKTKRIFVSRTEVRQVFKLSKAGTIAGCFVVKGKVLRKANVDVIRGGTTIHSSTISSLKRFKDDVREVPEGYECGISVNGFDAFEAGDILETFTLETIARTLAATA